MVISGYCKITADSKSQTISRGKTFPKTKTLCDLNLAQRIVSRVYSNFKIVKKQHRKRYANLCVCSRILLFLPRIYFWAGEKLKISVIFF